MRVSGIVESIIYRNDDNGYTVFLVKSSKTVFTFIGNIVKINVGENIDAEVTETLHETYGKQYKIVDYKIYIPDNDLDSVIKFLMSLNVKGVGEVTVKRIVAAFLNNTLDIIKNDSDKLYEVKGMNYEKIDMLREKVLERISELDIILELGKYQIGPKLIDKIISRYGDKTIEVVKNDPFRMAIDIDGIGFNICDKIAHQNGIERDSFKRIEAGIVYVLETEFAKGNVYVKKNDLIDKVSILLAVDGDMDYSDAFYNLGVNLKIKIDKYDDNECVFLRSAYNIEKKLSELLYNKREDITIITGGPGTGKTYNIKKYLNEATRMGLNVAICAPTGRAAKRVKEVTGYEAKTIHRLLECIGDKESSGERAYFNINEDNKLDTDLLIVDEMSMVDEYLMYALIRSIPDKVAIILVGDVDQLPSVGAGQVLKDMIESKFFNVLKLDKIYRQEDGSNIVENAHHVNRGKEIDLRVKSEDFIFVHKSSETNIKETIKKLMVENVPNHFKVSMDQIQVICPSKLGSCGTEALNIILQNELNPENYKKTELKVGNIIFRNGDKVMQISNNYNIPYDVVDEFDKVVDRGVGVYNGDIGEIVEIDEEEKAMVVRFDDRLAYYLRDELIDLSLAYAITVHKSQGSEYDVVIIPMIMFPHKLMTRKVLYTAMTRAKKCIIFVGTEESFYTMMNNQDEDKRNSALCSKLYLYEY